LKNRRAQGMMELKREGKSIKEIARVFEVSPRTVQRWLKAMEAASPFALERRRDSSFHPEQAPQSRGAVGGGDCHATFRC